MRKIIFALLIIPYSLFSQINISDFGASPSNTGDQNRAAINAAINSCNNCSIEIPVGVFNVSKPTGGIGYYGLGSLVIDGKTNIKIFGSKQSVIKLESGYYPGDSHVFYARNSNNLTFDGFTVNGNRYGHTVSTEQMHGIEIFDCNNVTISNMDLLETRGDGLFIIGNVLSNNIRVTTNNFIRNGRSGITLQRLVKNCFILSNYFENCNDQALDSEPTGGLGYENVFVVGNIFTKDSYSNILVTLGGSQSKNTTFESNKVLNGGLFVTSCVNCNIFNNYIEGSISVLEASKNVTIEKNQLKKDGSRGIYVYYQNGQPENFKIINNYIEGVNMTNVIDAQSNGLTIRGNELNVTSAQVGIKVAFPIISTNDLQDVTISDNKINNVVTGIVVDGSTTKKYRSAVISENTIQDFRTPKLITKGINISGSSSYFFSELKIYSNSFDASLSQPITLNQSAVNYYKTIDGNIVTNVEPTVTMDNGTIAKHNVLPYRYKSSGFGWSETDYVVNEQVFNTKTGINFTGNTTSTPFGTWLVSSEIVATSVTSSRAMYVIDSVNNGKIQVLVRSNAAPEFGGIVFRMKDELSYWLFRISNTKIQVVKRSGTESVIFETPNTYAQYLILSVEFNDDLISFFMNGRLIKSIKDSFNKEYGINGVYSNVANRYYFSDLIIGK